MAYPTQAFILSSYESSHFSKTAHLIGYHVAISTPRHLSLQSPASSFPLGTASGMMDPIQSKEAEKAAKEAEKAAKKAEKAAKNAAKRAAQKLRAEDSSPHRPYQLESYEIPCRALSLVLATYQQEIQLLDSSLKRKIFRTLHDPYTRYLGRVLEQQDGRPAEPMTGNTSSSPKVYGTHPKEETSRTTNFSVRCRNVGRKEPN